MKKKKIIKVMKVGLYMMVLNFGITIAHAEDINSCSTSGATKLGAAAYEGRIEDVKSLIARGADVNIV